MGILILNGSPKPTGTVATLLAAVAEGAGGRGAVDWVDVYGLDVAPCRGCMKCRPDGRCVLPEDDGHRVGEKLRATEALVVGTPTHWANMSAPLKTLLDRNVPALMGEKPGGMPAPRHAGTPAVVVTACTTPWPFHVLAGESSGAIRAVRAALRYSGMRVVGTLAKPGTRRDPSLSPSLLARAKRLGARLVRSRSASSEYVPT